MSGLLPVSCDSTSPTIDPAGVLVETADGLYAPGSLTFSDNTVPVLYSGPSAPPAGPDAVIGSGSLAIVNTLEVPALCILTVSLTANNQLHGSAQTDVKVYGTWDATPIVQPLVQVLHGLLGPIALDASLGGDGSLSGGRNSTHHDVTATRIIYPGDGFGVQPATIAAGASHTFDFDLTMTLTGLWADPLNPEDCIALFFATAGAILVPAG